MATHQGADEHTHLLPKQHDRKRSRLLSIAAEIDGESITSSHISKEEQALGETAVGERLPYNDYTTIDWLHDLVRTTSAQIPARTDLLRSKTPSDIERFVLERAFAIKRMYFGTR